VAGVDVGEDFLDIATFSPARQDLSLLRVDLRKLGAASAESTPRSRHDTNAITSLRAMLADTAPELRGAIVLVDSPRWPSDLDWSQPGVVAATNFHHGREIDAGLRALVFSLRKADADSTLAPLSMFPTPAMRYFGAQLNVATCKPHLRLLGQALFGEALNRDYGPASGGIFTRFMIVGFATYRALAEMAGNVYECYPDLQFRLWCRRQQLFSKNSPRGRTAALASRLGVLSALARNLGVGGSSRIRRIDEADAAILALSTVAAQRYGATLIVQNAGEGTFMVALDEPEAKHLQHEMVEPILNAAI
jgi:Protein of unknown function (DUF429)